MHVEMLNVGWFTAAAGIWRRGDDLDRKVRFPVPAYVIETAHDRILVDTGLHPGAVENAARHYDQPDALAYFDLELEASIGEQLDLADITQVVMTHLHFDHAGGLAEIPSSVPVVVQRREWEAGRDAAAIARNFYLPVDYASIDRAAPDARPHARPPVRTRRRGARPRRRRHPLRVRAGRPPLPGVR